MRRILAFCTIFIALTASAQVDEGLISRNLERVRPRTISYSRIADAQKSLSTATSSPYLLPITEWSEAKGGTSTTYTSHFVVNVGWLNRQVILRIGFADKALQVVVNGREAGYLACGAYGGEFNITKLVREGRNEVLLVVDNTDKANTIFDAEVQKRGAVAGDFADVEVLCQPTIRLRDVVYQTRLNEHGDGLVEVMMPIKCDALNRKELRLHYTLRLNDTVVVAEGYRELSLAMRAEDTLRFATTVPKKVLWNADAPTLLRLDIESRIDNRIAECVSKRVAFRSLEIKRDKLYINGESVALRLAEWSAVSNLDEVVRYGYNGIMLDCGYGFEQVIAECEKRGLYVVVRAPIDTTRLGDDIRKGGNPTNDPLWGETFAERCVGALNATKGSGAVVGYVLGRGKTCGVNIYDVYLLMKGLAPQYIVLYEGANGEWCSDKVSIK